MNLYRKGLPLLFSVFVCVLILSACKSSSDVDRSRPEYEYVPPVIISTPTPEPTMIPKVEEVDVSEADVSEAAVSDENSVDKKRGFFSRMFSKDKNKDGGQPTITRVGDTVEEELDEKGQLIIRDQPRDNVYRLRIGDALLITLSGSAGLDEQIETLIDDEGAIKLRFIGSVKAKGLSSTELEREIEMEYTDRQKIYKELTVRVHVPNTFYFIKGEIRQPGRFPVVGRVTLSQAIAAAGNFTEWADLQDIVLVRNNENVIINYKKIRRNPNLDVELLAGDTITVGRSTF